ncbi:MAG: hypothetical protein IJ866_00720 [Alphaproteobacteria bacterium]|nr:hypothetical protein [Alphaproteobacteria bacterium]
MATLFVVGVFICPNTPVSAIQRNVPQPTNTRTVVNRTSPKTVPARTTVSRATINQSTSSQTPVKRAAISTSQKASRNPINATKTQKPAVESATQTRTIVQKSSRSTTRRYQANTQSRTQSRTATIQNRTTPPTNDSTLVKMHIPADLRSSPNIQAYITMSGGDDYIVFKLFKNKLPNLSTLFQNLGGNMGVFAENNTTSTQIVATNGTPTTTSDREVYLLKQQTGGGGGACASNSDCGDGTCNASGICQCFDNASKGANGKCTCNSGYYQSGGACVADTSGTDTNNLTFTTCNTNSECASGQCNYGVCVKDDPSSFKCNEETIQPVFAITVKGTSVFNVNIRAAGTFFLFAPHGGVISSNGTTTCTSNIIKLERPTTAGTGTLSATITDSDEYTTLYFGGMATEYPNNDTPVIEFQNTTGTYIDYRPYIYEVSGSIGAIFPTIGDATSVDYTKQPRFKGLFSNAVNLRSIPSGLFDGIHGQPVADMFSGVFSGCTGLTGSIPDRLFAGLTGTADSLFASTFYNCSGLTGLIPANLFDGLTGPYKQRMFINTFAYCSGLTGNIPDGLFGNLTINDPLAYTAQTFSMTFDRCSGLTGYVPSSMYKGLDGKSVNSTFGTNGDTFYGCTGMATSCENGYIKDPAAANYEQYWSNHVACIPDGSSSPTPPAAQQTMTIPFSTADYELGNDTTADEVFTTSSRTINLASVLNNATGTVTVDWGDGTSVATITAGDALPSHTYTGNSVYNITLTGDIPEMKSTSDNVVATCTGNADEIRINETQCARTKFRINTTSDADEFLIYIGAAGTFYIDWDDGSAPSVITHATPIAVPYSHKYTTVQSRTIRIGGLATEYPPLNINPAISFFYNNISHPNYIHSVSGSLGELFPSYGTAVGQTPRFRNTFLYATNMYTIPNTLFSGISNGSGTVAPISSMFEGTFKHSGLTEIPTGLFAEIGGAPANSMFEETFYMAENLAGEIPSDLFAGIRGAPAEQMYERTFGSTKLSGELPDYLFGNLNGAPQYAMFMQTFVNDTGLTGQIPDHLFGDLTGSIDVRWAFYETFKGCSKLTGYIPSTLFGTVTGNAGDGTFSDTFTGTGLLENICPSNFHPYPTYNNRFATYWDGHIACEADDAIPADPALGTCTDAENEIVVGDGKCVTSKFIVETKSVSKVVFSISAAGIFYYDCGDGKGGHVINRTDDTTPRTYYCNYDTTGKYTVRFAGTATGYSTDEQTAAISFNYNESDSSKCDITSITGSLGSVFPSIDSTGTNGKTPRFTNTFKYCGLDSIPENLFSGVNGQPVSYMFMGTFSGAKATSIPAGLFSGINGTPTPHLFEGTFSGMTLLSGTISSDLFAGIRGEPAPYMFKSTFQNCYDNFYKRSFSIDDDLFSGISGAPATSMFESTFEHTTLNKLPPRLFRRISGAPATKMFAHTFDGTSPYEGGTCLMTTTPTETGGHFVADNFFGDIRGDATVDMFAGTFNNCHKMTGAIPQNLFGGHNLTGAAQEGVFSSTFESCSGLTGEIPDYLLGQLSGDAQPWAFNSTFYGCSGLTGTVPEHLFSGITGDIHMSFTYTFRGTGITAIHRNLFSGLNKITTNMLNNTFEDCTGLTEIPANLFASLNGKSATDANVTYHNGKRNEYSIGDIFEETFKGCTGLTSLPNKLFAGISGTVAGMFWGTFANTGITSIPADLFYDATTGTGISGATTERMFKETFAGCTNLASIPATLFAGISGAPAKYMYSGTFQGCTGLTTLPATMLFGNISGAPAEYMFQNTFMGCTGLTSLPDAPLFGIIGPHTQDGTGTTPTAAYMFANTFRGCTSLAGFIPAQMFWYWNTDKFSAADGMFSNVFTDTKLTGKCPTGYKQFVTNFEKHWGWTSAGVYPQTYRVACERDSSCDLGYVWNGSECVESTNGTPKTCTAGAEDEIKINDTQCVKNSFYITTSPTSSFDFNISAAGIFYVDWGDGNVQTINRENNVTPADISHTYASEQERVIKFGGIANGYNSVYSTAAISFNAINNSAYDKITGIGGSLGAIFPAVGPGSTHIPSFYGTFSGCKNIESVIPYDLFAGSLNSSPRSGMFTGTFYNCKKLVGFIPQNMFGNISTIPSNADIFENTFGNCDNLATETTGCGADGYAQYISGFESQWSNHIMCGSTYSSGTWNGYISASPINCSASEHKYFNGFFNKCMCDVGYYEYIPNRGTSNEGTPECVPYDSYGMALCTKEKQYVCYNINSLGNVSLLSNSDYDYTRLVGHQMAAMKNNGTQVGRCIAYVGTGSDKQLVDAGYDAYDWNKNNYGRTKYCGNSNDYLFKIKFQDQNGAPISVHINGLFDEPVDHIIINPNIDYSSVIPGYTHRWRYPNEDVNDLLRVIKADPANATLFSNYIMESRIKSNGNTNGEQGYNTGELYFPDNVRAEPAFASDDGYYPTEYYLTFNSITCAENQFATNGSCVDSKFSVITTNNTNSLIFSLGAQGTFFVDCGDGGTLTQAANSHGTISGKQITRSLTSETTYTCTWSSAGEHTIRFGGEATGYGDNSTISFYQQSNGTQDKIKSISGSLGAIFPVVGGVVPKFSYTFYSTRITSIPANLFSGIDTSSATNTSDMFSYTFNNTNITSIPSDLFSTINTSSATNTDSMFLGTFGYTNITEIPANLFSTIDTSSATNTSHMFNSTFNNTNITSIPTGLFGTINTSSAIQLYQMFFSTFQSTKITEIPVGLFDTINTSSVTDPEDNARTMFANTFYGTPITKIPAGLFQNITVAGNYMFSDTFARCSNLSGYIPYSAFKGLIDADSPIADKMWKGTFDSTQLIKTVCPYNTTPVSTQYETEWGGYVVCEPN